MVHSISPFIHSISRLKISKIIEIIRIIMFCEFMWIYGSGMITINSMSKITKIMAIIKNWLENLRFFSDRELNPHSILVLEEKFFFAFFFIEYIIVTSSVTRIEERNRWCVISE